MLTFLSRTLFPCLAVATTAAAYDPLTLPGEQLAVWNKESGHPLAGRLDLDRIGMSGHSFGAGTTQGVGGQSFPGAAGRRFTDARIRAAVAFSPSAPATGDPQAAFAGVTIPWM